MSDTNQFLILTVTKGSVMIGVDGSRTILEEVPKNALELWEAGNYAFCLKKDNAADLLKDYSSEQIQSLIDVRTPLGYKAELETLKSLLKSSPKGQVPAEVKKK
ncbi:hypothetical protein ACNFU2_06515 [Chryseobacterium sp. PTM-20240506]|uniref:hypothetical protein n=1 Tax=Chryseobacterium sp. PTM-20240506 TaxID=3400631 RepID=UPI003AAB3820